MQEWIMTVKSRLPILIAEHNAERARAGLPTLSNPEIAEAAAIEYTRLYRLLKGQQGWNLEVIDKLMHYFQLNSFDQLFEYREESRE